MTSASNSTRLNKFIAQATGMSRREADEAIEADRVLLNGTLATLGQRVEETDDVRLDGNILRPMAFSYVLLNKPVNYVSSRKQQGENPTIYTLLPDEFQHLKPAGRLDADSHGLMLLTNDGKFAHEMTHPSYKKQKAYTVKLDKELSEEHRKQIESGVELEDGMSSFSVRGTNPVDVVMQEGRNRQIRRTFDALGYTVVDLERFSLGPYNLADLGEKVYSTTDKRK